MHHVVVGGGYVGERVRHLVERPLPEVAGEGEDVGLVHQSEVAAGTRLGQLVGEAHAPLHAHAGVHRSLGGHLVRRPPAQDAALPGVEALGVLADDHGVDAGALHGPQVHIEIELEAETQQQAALDDPGRHARRAHGTEEDGVQPPQLAEHRVGEDVARAQVAVAAQVVVDGVEGHPGGAHDLERLGDHLRPDAVTGEDPDPVGHAISAPEKRKTAHFGGRSTAHTGGVCATE
jgi:hypothetical protein